MVLYLNTMWSLSNIQHKFFASLLTKFIYFKEPLHLTVCLCVVGVSNSVYKQFTTAEPNKFVSFFPSSRLPNYN